MDKIFNLARTSLASLPSLSGISDFNYTWLLGGLGAVALSLYGLNLGRTRAVLSLLAIYITFTFEKLFPYMNEIQGIIGGPFDAYWIRISLFMVVYCIVFFILNMSFIRIKLFSIEFSFISVVVISLLQFGFLLSILLSFLPEDLALLWLAGFYGYFSSQQALFFWSVAPLPVLLFLKSK